MADLLETPSRVLRRVQQYEEMELPSLPSFQHDLDFESGSFNESHEEDAADNYNDSVCSNGEEVNGASQSSAALLPSQLPYSTPYAARPPVRSPGTESTVRPFRRVSSQNQESSSSTIRGSQSSTVRGSQSSSTARTSPLLPDARAVSSQGPSVRYTREFDTSYLNDLTRATTGQEALDRSHSGSGSGSWEQSSTSARLPPPSAADELQDHDDDLPSLPEIPMSDSGLDSEVADTPIPRQYERKVSRSPPYRGAPSEAGTESRIPSLSRSELSVTDSEATTPEGPARVLLEPSLVSEDGEGTENQLHDDLTTRTFLTDILEESLDLSPVKPGGASSVNATPAPMRYMDHPSTAARAAATPFGNAGLGGPLNDITPANRNRISSATPSPGFSPSSIDYNKTPRAPLDDAERRKSHVLSVLATASLPSRFKRTSPQPHPLRRTSFAPEAESVADSSLAGTMRSNQSVEESKVHNDSFISIASSDDLTPDRRGSRSFAQRGNTSVPTIGAHGALNLDNRPDAIKIQKHLNMMNKQLLETNADLAREAEDWREECTRLLAIMREAGFDVDEEGNIGDIAGYVLKRIGDDESDELPTIPLADESTLYDRLHTLQGEIREKDAELTTLRDKVDLLGSRENSSARSSLRGSGNFSKEKIRAELEAELKGEFAEKTETHAQQFAAICKGYEEEVTNLQLEISDLKAENELLHNDKPTSHIATEADLEDLRDQIATLEDELAETLEEVNQANDQLDAAKKDLAEARRSAEDVLQRLADSESDASGLKERLTDADHLAHQATQQIDDFEEALGKAEAAKAEAEAELEAVQLRLSESENALAKYKDEFKVHRELIDELEETVESQRSAIGKLEDDSSLARQDTEHERKQLQQDLDAAQASLSEKEAEIASLQGKLEVNALEKDMSIEESNHDFAQDADRPLVMALEDRLDDAYREIGRLKHELNGSSARATAIESRDAKIRVLEAEKDSLLERIKAREMASPVRLTGSISRNSTPSHKVLASLRMPATPGPMKDFSWMHSIQSSLSDANEPILRAKLEHLQHELDVAHTQLDRNFSRLEDAGMGSIELAEKLASAQDRISELEDQIRSLARENKKSLASLNFGKGRNQELEDALDAVRDQTDALKRDLTAERERLGDENRRLRINLADLQIKFDDEIEALGGDMARIQQEADDRVARTERDLRNLRLQKNDVEAKLRVSEAEVKRLEADIRVFRKSADDARKASEEATRQSSRLREQMTTAVESEETIHNLQLALREVQEQAEHSVDLLHERERELELAQQELADLKSERARVSIDLNQNEGALEAVRNEVTNLRTERTKLSRDLFKCQRDLEAAQREVSDLKVERARVAKDLAEFGGDLGVQRRECAKFGAELDLLRKEQSDGKLAQSKQLARVEDQLRITRDRLDKATRDADEAHRRYSELSRQMAKVTREADKTAKDAIEARRRRDDLERQLADRESGANDAALAQRQHFKLQTRTLSAQIQYLKAKYQRESTFRNALSLQKKFLLLLVGGMSLNEQATLRQIASMGYEVKSPPRPKRTMRSVGLAVLALVRTQRLATQWRGTKETRTAAVLARRERKSLEA